MLVRNVQFKKNVRYITFWQNVIYLTFYFCQYDFYRFLHREITFWQNVRILTFWQNVICCRNASNFCYIKVSVCFTRYF